MRHWIASAVSLACLPGLPSSARADPSTSQACADAYVSGQRLRNAHELIEARGAFRACAQTSCAAFIVKDCSEWLDGVQASIPAILPIATDDAGSMLSDVRVAMDGTVLVTAIDGRSIEVDPGLHRFSFEASDGRTAHASVLVAEGDKMVRVTVKVVRPIDDGPLRASPTPAAPPREPPKHGDGMSPWRILGLGVAALGAVGLGAGAAYGLDTMSKKSAAGCDSHDSCSSPTAQEELEAAQRSGTLSTVFFVAGGVLTTVGVLVWFFAPRSPVGAGVAMGTHGTTLVLDGAW